MREEGESLYLAFDVGVPDLGFKGAKFDSDFLLLVLLRQKPFNPPSNRSIEDPALVGTPIFDRSGENT